MLHVNPKVNLIYWTKGQPQNNLGDLLGSVMLDRVGISVVNDGPCCFTIGTSLSGSWWKITKGPRLIWGSGSCGFDLPLLDDNILAVRGPLTIKWLNLPEDTPQGDPALLMPRLYRPKQIAIGPLAVLNYHTDLEIPMKAVSMKIHRDQWCDVLDSIANAEIVLANSLHASILAHAYGRPWAVFRPLGGTNPLPKRWEDWFAYLGLPAAAIVPVASLEAGFVWWEKWGKLMQIRSLDPLIDCCPWPLLERALR